MTGSLNPAPELGPPTYRPDTGWQVTRYADVRAVLTDARFVVPPVPPAPPGTMAGLRATVARFSTGDPHARRRALVEAAVPDAALPALRQAAYDRTVAELARTPAGGRFDLMPLARAVPVGVLAAELGVEPTVTGEVAAMVARVATAYQPGAAPERERAADAALARLVALLPAAPDEILANRIGLLVQTCDATAGLIGNALCRVLRQPAPDWPTAGLLAETLRADPPVRLTRRVADRPAPVGGTRIEPGAPVLVWFEAANRDPAVFAEPDRFDPGRFAPHRPPVGVLTFGAGTHRCPGSAYALALATGVVDAVRQRCQPADTGTVHYEPSTAARIPSRVEATIR